MKIYEIRQGTKFLYMNKIYMKLPNYCECYGHPCNAVDIVTGTMVEIGGGIELEIVEE